MLFAILLTVQIIVCLAVIALVLMQRSEGGALGMGGGPSGFMSARGTGNLLTRGTAILGVIFFANSIGLTIVGNYSQRSVSAVDKVDTSGLTLDKSALPAAPAGVATSSAAGPSLSDLPLAPSPSANQPAMSAPKPAASAARSVAPVKLPADPQATAPVSQKQVEKAKANIWDTPSSSAAKSGAASTSKASSAPASSASNSSASR
ncbi:MAG: preprotein translocase subunit SecG [Asticcacaulis sp.]